MTETNNTAEKLTENKPDNSAAAKEQKASEPQINPSAPNTAPPQIKSSKAGVALSCLAITMVLALGGGVYHFGLQKNYEFTSEIQSLNNQISLLKNELEQANSSHAAESALAKQARDKLQIVVTQQDNSLSSLQSAIMELRGRRPNDWLLAEADHLIKQAGRQLWIEKDLNTTIRLVETADQRIAQLNDPSLTPVRQAMANDLQSLKSIERIDSDGIVLKIASLQNQVNSLVLANALLAEEIKELSPQEVSQEISNWKENLLTSLKDFAGQFITYRKREGSVVPLLTPAQTFYLQENVKAKLAQAINAVYRENTELYLSSLATAKLWVNDFYNLELPETQGFIESINELEKQTIKVEYPSELTSLTLITDELSQRLNKELSNLVNASRGDQ